MASSSFIKARVSSTLKERIRANCAREFLSESAWLKRLVLKDLQASGCDSSVPAREATIDRDDSVGRVTRVYVRLRSDDADLLEARALARGMRSATYLSVLTRSHLRHLAPLPKEELLALKRCLGELGMLGRNLNQIVRSANSGMLSKGSAREEFNAMLKICEALRVETKALLKRNLQSWESGFAEI